MPDPVASTYKLICPVGANQFDQFAPIHLAHLALNGVKSLVPKSQFHEWIQSDGRCPVLAQKYLFPKIGNCGTLHVSRLDKRGVRVVTNVGRDAMDVEVPLTSSAKADGEIVWS